MTEVKLTLVDLAAVKEISDATYYNFPNTAAVLRAIKFRVHQLPRYELTHEVEDELTP